MRRLSAPSIASLHSDEKVKIKRHKIVMEVKIREIVNGIFGSHSQKIKQKREPIPAPIAAPVKTTKRKNRSRLGKFSI